MNPEAPHPQRRWLTEKELAALLNISTRHLINLRRAGLPYVQLGSVVRYEPAEVSAYLKANRRVPSHATLRPSEAPAG